ncbi:hypothetical protein [uncultured Clostridium sp.]|uniref:hypothetical protein n=1 Tax=uncultured Clostridium sp. TaxID=59620 RepID=UPI0025D27953|nr:hypothetical protein [uncultured Clostridium sp.]
MKYNESNFTYLKVTSLSRYYPYLLKAECSCEDFPRMTKIILRRVIEAFIRDKALSYGINDEYAVGQMLKILRYHEEFNMPEEIYDYIQIIRVNGIGITLYRSRDKRIDKHPIELLELLHRVFLWYLKLNEKDTIGKFANLSFKAPNTIEFEEHELKKVKRDISLKDNQIYNLREKVIELAEQSKSVGELNRIIIAIKEEREEMNKYRTFLEDRINSHKYEIEEIKKSYEKEISEFDLVREDCIESHNVLAKKESLLVRAELDNQKVRSMIEELEESDDIIEEREAMVESQLDSIRKGYEKLVELTNRYQDDSETIVFTYCEELKKTLITDKSEAISELNFEDTAFYNKITEYNKAIEETKRKVILFKGMLDDKIKKSVKFNDFYNAFLNLNGNKLRLLYAMVSNWNKNNFNLLSKSKEWLLNRNNEESFLDMVNKTVEEVKDRSDEQIKLALYYKLLRISEVQIKNICNRKNFIKAVDSIVQSAYVALVDTKDFNYYLSKTHSIKVYYLKKVIEKLKSRYKSIKINEELVYKIYDEIVKLSFKNEVYFVESLKIDTNNEHALKTAIRKQPFEFLSIIIEIGEEFDYKIVYRIIFDFLKDVTAISHDITSDQLSLERFLTGPFRIMLFISSGDGLSSKYADDVIPLFVGEVLVSDSIRSDDKVDFESYNRMIEVWKKHQIFYKDKFNTKKDINDELKNLLNEKGQLTANIENLSHEEELFKQKYASYKDEFKQIIISSDKCRMLESYERYKECEAKMKETSNVSESTGETSIIEAWVEQASRKINESNFAQSEAKLIEEAKESHLFDKEYKVFEEIEDMLKEIDNDLYNNRKILKEKDDLINLSQLKLEKLDEYLDALKEIYPDIE